MDEWLEKLNNEFTEKDIPHKQRPFEAVRRYAVEKKVSIVFGSELFNQIYDWFKNNTKEGSGKIGTSYSSVFFYDGEFWELEIFVFWGTEKVNPFNSLVNMPPVIKNKLLVDPIKSIDYEKHWADCFDFNMGYQSIKSSDKYNEFGQDFLNGGYEELCSSATLLRTDRLNPRAILNSRMAVEMFFKAFAALQNSLTEKEAKEINHFLERGLEKMIELTGQDNLNNLKPKLAIYPKEVSERYKAQNVDNLKQWEAFQTAQHVGAIVTRQFTEYNVLADVGNNIKNSRIT